MSSVTYLYALKAESPDSSIVATFGTECEDYMTHKIGCNVYVEIIGESEGSYDFLEYQDGEVEGYDLEVAQQLLNKAVMATILENHKFLIAKKDFYYLEIGINETVNVELARDSVLCYLEDAHRGPYNMYPIAYNQFEQLISWIEVFTKNSLTS